MVKILFVCLGNICRSPTAHGVFEKMVADANLAAQIGIESAGTAAYHVGESPDIRACQAASDRGYDLSHIRARQVMAADFKSFDYILAMDHANVQDLRRNSDTAYHGKIELFLQYGSQCDITEVPDPYYGGKKGFQQVLDLVEDAAEGLLTQLRSQL